MALKKPVVNEQEDQTTSDIENAQTEQVDVQETVQGDVPKSEDSPAESTEVQTVEKPVSSTEMTAPSSGKEFSSRMSDQGYDGMELGFGAFPIIKLANEGSFIDSDETDHGKGFACQLLSTRPSYLYKQQDNNDSPVAYSYDGINLTNTTEQGSSTVEELRAEWVLDRWTLERKEYIEGVIVMKGDSEFADEMFLISIAPNSRRKIAGVLAGAEYRGEKISEVTLQCSVGAKRKHGSNTYFPWAFKILRD